jgi:hypothetical protein
VTGVQTCALPISQKSSQASRAAYSGRLQVSLSQWFRRAPRLARVGQEYSGEELASIGNEWIHSGWGEREFGDPDAASRELLSLAKYRDVRATEKSGGRAAALQIASSQYYGGLSWMSFEA